MVVSKSESRNACSSSLRPISRTATAAHFRACRERQQTAQTGEVETRSSSDFKAMPAANAAPRSSGSRPRVIAQPGRTAGRTRNDAGWSAGESMMVTISHRRGLCHICWQNRTAR